MTCEIVEHPRPKLRLPDFIAFKLRGSENETCLRISRAMSDPAILLIKEELHHVMTKHQQCGGIGLGDGLNIGMG